MDVEIPLTLAERVREAPLVLPAPEEGTKGFRGVLEGALGFTAESPEARRARRAAQVEGLPASNRPGADPTELERYRLQRAAAQFEGFFVQMMMKSMRATIEKCELFDGGRGEEVFQEMFDQQIAESSSQGRGIGLGQMIYRQMVQFVTPKQAPGLDLER